MRQLMKNKEGATEGGGNLWVLVFIVVLLLHIIFILGFMGFNLLKSMYKEPSNTKSTPGIQEQKYSKEEPPANRTSEKKPFLKSEIPASLNPISANGFGDNADETEMPQKDLEKLLASLDRSSGTSSLPETSAIDPTTVETLTNPVNPIGFTESSGNYYIVVEGDTLMKIAVNTGVSINDIRKKNRLEKDVVKIGQKLIIPGKSENKTLVSAVNTRDPQKQPISTTAISPKLLSGTTGAYKTYRVEKGDTLNKIAILSHTTPENLVKINNISDPRKLKVGMEIKVPRE
jgi:LysM repeat protein